MSLMVFRRPIETVLIKNQDYEFFYSLFVVVPDYKAKHFVLKELAKFKFEALIKIIKDQFVERGYEQTLAGKQIQKVEKLDRSVKKHHAFHYQ